MFDELSKMVDVSFADDLNNWLYGPIISTLMTLKQILNPEKIVAIIGQPCIGCRVELETFIMRKEEGIPDYEWVIATCNACRGFNRLSFGPNRKETKFGNYTYVEQLFKTGYNEQEALIRMEQIKLFRK